MFMRISPPGEVGGLLPPPLKLELERRSQGRDTTAMCGTIKHVKRQAAAKTGRKHQTATNNYKMRQLRVESNRAARPSGRQFLLIITYFKFNYL